MKYSPVNYAKAYIETKPAPKDFLRVVEKFGDISRLKKIVAAIEELAAKEAGGHIIDMEFARGMEKKLVEKMKNKFTAKDIVHVSINPSLVAGVRITIDGTKELDNSFRRKINTLFV